VFYCTVNRKGLLSWANAGHPKPFLVRPGTELVSLQTTGMPLGMLEMASYDVQEIQLLSGDKVVIFSDGLSEAENTEGQFFDRSGLTETIEANVDQDCAGLHAALLKAVESFTEGGELSDDITLLVLEYRA
jgi:sigma-B regulation protein RsbU (phosphoserine phosphatase)